MILTFILHAIPCLPFSAPLLAEDYPDFDADQFIAFQNNYQASVNLEGACHAMNERKKEDINPFSENFEKWVKRRRKNRVDPRHHRTLLSEKRLTSNDQHQNEYWEVYRDKLRGKVKNFALQKSITAQLNMEQFNFKERQIPLFPDNCRLDGSSARDLAEQRLVYHEELSKIIPIRKAYQSDLQRLLIAKAIEAVLVEKILFTDANFWKVVDRDWAISIRQWQQGLWPDASIPPPDKMDFPNLYPLSPHPKTVEEYQSALQDFNVQSISAAQHERDALGERLSRALFVMQNESYGHPVQALQEIQSKFPILGWKFYHKGKVQSLSLHMVEELFGERLYVRGDDDNFAKQINRGLAGSSFIDINLLLGDSYLEMIKKRYQYFQTHFSEREVDLYLNLEEKDLRTGEKLSLSIQQKRAFAAIKMFLTYDLSVILEARSYSLDFEKVADVVDQAYVSWRRDVSYVRDKACNLDNDEKFEFMPSLLYSYFTSVSAEKDAKILPNMLDAYCNSNWGTTFESKIESYVQGGTFTAFYVGLLVPGVPTAVFVGVSAVAIYSHVQSAERYLFANLVETTGFIRRHRNDAEHPVHMRSYHKIMMFYSLFYGIGGQLGQRYGNYRYLVPLMRWDHQTKKLVRMPFMSQLTFFSMLSISTAVNYARLTQHGVPIKEVWKEPIFWLNMFLSYTISHYAGHQMRAGLSLSAHGGNILQGAAISQVLTFQFENFFLILKDLQGQDDKIDSRLMMYEAIFTASVGFAKGVVFNTGWAYLDHFVLAAMPNHLKALGLTVGKSLEMGLGFLRSGIVFTGRSVETMIALNVYVKNKLEYAKDGLTYSEALDRLTVDDFGPGKVGDDIWKTFTEAKEAGLVFPEFFGGFLSDAENIENLKEQLELEAAVFDAVLDSADPRDAEKMRGEFYRRALHEARQIEDIHP